MKKLFKNQIKLIRSLNSKKGRKESGLFIVESKKVVLELIGTTTLIDSLRCVSSGGIVCMTGILGGKWTLENFQPMGDIPTAVKLTSYSGEASNLSVEQFQKYLDLIEEGELNVETGPIFEFEKLIQSHELMDANQAGGKIVVLGKQ